MWENLAKRYVITSYPNRSRSRNMKFLEDGLLKLLTSSTKPSSESQWIDLVLTVLRKSKSIHGSRTSHGMTYMRREFQLHSSHQKRIILILNTQMTAGRMRTVSRCDRMLCCWDAHQFRHCSMATILMTHWLQWMVQHLAGLTHQL